MAKEANEGGRGLSPTIYILGMVFLVLTHLFCSWRTHRPPPRRGQMTLPVSSSPKIVALPSFFPSGGGPTTLEPRLREPRAFGALSRPRRGESSLAFDKA